MSEATRGADVAAYVAPLLGCTPGSVRLWGTGGGDSLLQPTAQPLPGHRFTAKLAAGPGKW